ncbi:MAG: type II toxin-antitoxin system VapC family toxin [Bacteroidota bacterium]
MSVPKIVIHTDVFIEHLAGNSSPSLLRQAMGKFFCYASVFHAIELFSMTRTETERKAVEDMMAAMKVLGLNPKNAPRYGQLVASHPRKNRNLLLIAGLCLESRLPILTDRRGDFKGITGLVCVPTVSLGHKHSGMEILSAAQRG